MQGRRNNYKCIEQVWYYECIDWCLYQVVLFFIFCKDDSEMLKAFDKTIKFFHVLQRNVTAATPPPPPPPPPPPRTHKRTYDVSRGHNRTLLPLGK
jgi:hypothetical protein